MSRKAAPLAVEVSETVVFSNTWNGERRDVHRWVIIVPGTSFRLEVTECPCNLKRLLGVTYAPLAPGQRWSDPREVVGHRTAPMINCLCAYEGGKCTRATAADRDLRCHGWHRAKVDATAEAIAKRTPWKPATGGVPRGKLRESAFLPLRTGA